MPPAIRKVRFWAGTPRQLISGPAADRSIAFERNGMDLKSSVMSRQTPNGLGWDVRIVRTMLASPIAWPPGVIHAFTYRFPNEDTNSEGPPVGGCAGRDWNYARTG
jgi:hypothetical protein